MKAVLFQIGKFKLHTYGLMIAIGILMAEWVGEKRAKKYGLKDELILDLTIWCGVGGILGAKLMYIIVEWKDVFSGHMSFSDFMYGFVVYGGIIGGIFAGWLYCKLKKLPFFKYFDLVMPSIALAQGFGRIGCFFAGCCYGKKTNAWYGMKFIHSVYEDMRDVKVIPTQLLMSAGNFLHFALLVWIAGVIFKKKKPDGIVAGCYLIFYSIGRFLIEFLRDDPRGAIRALSTSQFISIFIFAAGVALVLWRFQTKPVPVSRESGKSEETNDSEKESKEVNNAGKEEKEEIEKRETAEEVKNEK